MEQLVKVFFWRIFWHSFVSGVPVDGVWKHCISLLDGKMKGLPWPYVKGYKCIKAKFAFLPIITIEGKIVWLSNYYVFWETIEGPDILRWYRVKRSYKKSNLRILE